MTCTRFVMGEYYSRALVVNNKAELYEAIKSCKGKYDLFTVIHFGDCRYRFMCEKDGKSYDKDLTRVLWLIGRTEF